MEGRRVWATHHGMVAYARSGWSGMLSVIGEKEMGFETVVIRYWSGDDVKIGCSRRRDPDFQLQEARNVQQNADDGCGRFEIFHGGSAEIMGRAVFPAESRQRGRVFRTILAADVPPQSGCP